VKIHRIFKNFGYLLGLASCVMCFVETIIYFYTLSKTSGFWVTLIMFILPFHSFPIHSVFKPIDFLVDIILFVTPPCIAFMTPLLAPFTLGDWTPFYPLYNRGIISLIGKRIM
jgi:hypothetical protein